MEKKIEDYLHLYLGCECKSQGQEKDGTLKLTGVSYESMRDILWAYFDNEDDSYAVAPDVCLILRPLSDMTEEERDEFWIFIFRGFNYPSGKKFNGITRFIDKSTTNPVPRWVLMQGVERVGIEWDGHVWADSDLHPWMFNRAEVTLWLLKKSFDLFELIENNLALDKTKL